MFFRSKLKQKKHVINSIYSYAILINAIKYIHYSMNFSHSVQKQQSLLTGSQLVLEIDIICRLEDTETSTGLVQRWGFDSRV